MPKLKLFIKKPWVIATGIIIVIIAVFMGFRSNKPKTYDFEVAKRGPLIQEVNVTGRVKPAQNVDLAFERSGKIAKALVKVGDKVKTGQLLVSLNSADIAAQASQAAAGIESAKANLNQYRAGLASAQAKLDELLRGTRPEEILITETNVQNAESSVRDAETNLQNVQQKAATDISNAYGDILDTLNDAYIKADDAVNKQIDGIFTSDLYGYSPQLTFTLGDSQLENDILSQRSIVAGNLKKWQTELNALTQDAPQTTLEMSLNSARFYLSSTRDFLEKLMIAVDKAVGLVPTTASAYKTNITFARTNVNAALTSVSNLQQLISGQKSTNQNNISAAQSKVNDAKNALLRAQNELSLKQAGATQEQIAAQQAITRQAEANISSQEAMVRQAQANFLNYQAQLGKTVIRAPISGIVTKQDAKAGEIVGVNVTVVSLISEAKFEIDANIPEADIAKVKVNNKARVTLDAYGSDVIFEAQVVAIEPTETIVEGVSTYKTTLQFAKDDIRIKSGMTANIDIATDKRENVIAVPQRAVITKNGDKFVRILSVEPKEVRVKLGIRGSDGRIEIIEGISEGDKVLVSVD